MKGNIAEQIIHRITKMIEIMETNPVLNLIEISSHDTFN